MLMSFNVENYKSIKERQEISLIKTNLTELNNNYFSIINEQNENTIELLKSAVIYGANASGKSNFLSALGDMRGIVCDFSIGNLKTKKIDSLKIKAIDIVSDRFFKFDKNCSNKPIEFEIELLIKSVKYQYGFSIFDKKIHSEWLYAYPKGRTQKWFVRDWNENKKTHDWSFSPNLIGPKKLWMTITKNDVLLLPLASHLNCEQINPIYKWFENCNCFLNKLVSYHLFTTSLLLENSRSNTNVIKLLQSTDSNIQDIKIEHDDKKNSNKIICIRKDKDGIPVHLDFFNNESEGTKKMYSLAGPLIDILETGGVAIIDELECNLHPLIVENIVDLFHNKKTNPNNSQLIFSTHLPTILNDSIFRRDQVWFTEKDHDNTTCLYSLSDFKTPKNKVDLTKSYLLGKFGAIPTNNFFED